MIDQCLYDEVHKLNDTYRYCSAPTSGLNTFIAPAVTSDPPNIRSLQCAKHYLRQSTYSTLPLPKLHIAPHLPLSPHPQKKPTLHYQPPNNPPAIFPNPPQNNAHPLHPNVSPPFPFSPSPPTPNSQLTNSPNKAAHPPSPSSRSPSPVFYTSV